MTSGNAQAPFLDFKSFVAKENETQETAVRNVPSVGSPFISVYESGEGESEYEDPNREAYSSIVNELYDEEFDEALFELLTDARDLHHEHIVSGLSDFESEQALTQHFSQLIRESEAMVGAMARQFGSGGEAVTDRELELFVDNYSPSGSLSPAFENFFGKLFKKIGSAVKTVARTAWQGAKGLGLGFVLDKIKALIKPLLNKVLQAAIGRLPIPLQPVAQKLAERLGLAQPSPAPAAESAGSPVQETGAPGVTEMQLEFNQQIAEALLAQDEVELNSEVASIRSGSNTPANPVFSELDQARENFIQELENLKEGESPEPHIQNFLPAILPALKIGIGLIGRPKVVNFLAQLLAKLISKLIGPEQAPALSQAIVDAGLKFINLEMSEQEKSSLGASAVAATVEETVNRVASLPEHILDNQELLEGFALEAFEQAAAANLPAVLSEATYRHRPDLLEGGVNAAWLLLPLRGRKRYKRCSRVFKVRITPHMAEELESFEGAPISEYLQDQLGLPEGAEVEAEVHLYETLPGTTAADIARSENQTAGLGASDEATVSQLHPLTQEAAGVLLGKPGLGRALPSGSDVRNLATGQRMYHLGIKGHRALTHPGKLGRKHVRRLIHINLTLDGTTDQITVCVFISEVKAQKMAVRLRQQAHAGSLAVGFHRFLSHRLGAVLHGKHPKRLKVVYAGLAPGPSIASALQRLPSVVPRIFVKKIKEWLLHGFTDFIKTQPQKFIAAAEDPADGVTLRFTIEHPQGLKELCQALVDKLPGAKVADAVSQGSRPMVRVEVFPGHHCG